MEQEYPFSSQQIGVYVNGVVSQSLLCFLGNVSDCDGIYQVLTFKWSAVSTSLELDQLKSHCKVNSGHQL